MASDIFAKIGDIKGESTDDRHRDEIEVVSFAWGLANAAGPALAGGASVGKASVHDLSVVHPIDKASPLLLQACASGQHLKDATITHRKAGRTPYEYLVVRLTDVLVTGVTHAGSTGQPPQETVTLAFGKIDFEYRAQKPDGSVDAGIHFIFDVKANRVG